MVHLLNLRGISTVPATDGNDAILFQTFLPPNLRSRWFLFKGAHDVDVVGGTALERRRWDEDLIAPKDGETAGAGGCVDASLAHNCLENGDGFEGAVG